MTSQLSEEEIYEAAKKRVKHKKDFYSHLVVYIVINLMLVLIWAFTGHGYPWFIWPLGGWGIGVIFHGLDVFFFHKQSGWELKEIEKEAENIRKSQNK